MIGRRGHAVLLNVPTTHYLCWYCSKQLPAIFTSVEKNGQTLRVHTECRAPAAELVEFDVTVRRALQGSLIIEDQADTFVRVRYVPEERMSTTSLRELLADQRTIDGLAFSLGGLLVFVFSILQGAAV